MKWLFLQKGEILCPFSRIFSKHGTSLRTHFRGALTASSLAAPPAKTINERTALQTTAVYACVRILAETISSLPLHTFRYTDRGKEKALRLTTHSSVHPATTILDIILSQIRHIQMNVGYFNQILNSSDLRSPLWLGYNEG